MRDPAAGAAAAADLEESRVRMDLGLLARAVRLNSARSTTSPREEPRTARVPPAYRGRGGEQRERAAPPLVDDVVDHPVVPYR